ncbi:MAG: lysophospholipid acyltransferase family protein [Sulfurospirillaceae bacterium]|nr:lysophospholipid acyltransferase family protein [Sulfurospirillaceae bacterium]MDD3463640.1 lysophospholipid acyltransferase family protein [Sulfurospirillaceae bacterium]
MLSKIRGIITIFQFVVTVLITIVLMYAFKSKTHKIRLVWAKMQTYLMSFNILIKNKPSDDAKMIMLNHQSLVDIVALEGIYPKNLCWVAKKEIGDIPLFGHILRAPKMIEIDRKDSRSMVKMLKQAKERLSEGRVIAIFPEGTRGKGEKLLKFQNGAKVLAEKLNLVVQPVVVVGTRYVFDSKNLSAHSGDVRVVYLEPINPADDENWYAKVHAKMQEVLNAELQAIGSVKITV